MKSSLPEEGLIKLIIKKVKNPFYIIIIIALYLLNDYLKIIKTKEFSIAICIILICIVILKDTIYKCLDRLCKRDENIEKEKTKRLLSKDAGKNDKDSFPDNKNDFRTTDKSSNMRNDGDVKVYDIKHKKSS